MRIRKQHLQKFVYCVYQLSHSFFGTLLDIMSSLCSRQNPVYRVAMCPLPQVT